MNKECYPCLNINLNKIAHNLEYILKQYGSMGIQITPVTKGVCGSVEIAKLFSKHEIHSIGDSHLQNIQRMKEAGVEGPFMLLRSPMLNEAESVIIYADISLNSEMVVIKSLDQFATRHGKIHDIVLMIELGDLREGIPSTHIDEYIKQISLLNNIRLIGIGSNLICLNGIKPTIEKMELLSSFAKKIKEKYATNLKIVSGGNSANFQWAQEVEEVGLINHLRIGESILLGTDPISRMKITGLMDDTFVLEAMVIESKQKPSKPSGVITFDAFGEVPSVKDEGEINRSLLAIGQQDLDIKGCNPIDRKIKILGATSDHLVVKSVGKKLTVGEIVEFRIAYRALLHLMISPYVKKRYIS